MNHDMIQEMLVSYVFGGLNEGERQSVDDHLEHGCAECTQELRNLNDVAVEMSRELPQSTPPSKIKSYIMQGMQENPTVKSRLSGRITWLSWSIAAAAVLCLVVLGLEQKRLKEINAELERRLTEARDVTELLSAPSMQFINLSGVIPNEQAFGKVVLDPAKGAAVVYMYRLPLQPQGKEYQLWVMRDGQPTSAGLFRVGNDGGATLTLETLPHIDSIPRFLVTIEPEGGQLLPTGMIYLTTPQ